jgi:hypothetical protein
MNPLLIFGCTNSVIKFVRTRDPLLPRLLAGQLDVGALDHA